jgi:hypothetical protein
MIPEKPPHLHGWRDVLAWGCVFCFLLAPPLVFALQLAGIVRITGEGQYAYLKDWYFSVTGMLVSLAGLKTWQQNVATKAANGNGKDKE